jgi:lipoate---protein ligase
MPMALLDRTLPTLNENLALDEALLLAAEAGEGGEVVRFWEWADPAVVLGAGGSVAIDVDEAACATDGVPIHRRASGGGTVLLGRGCLLFSLVLAYDRAAELRDVNASYRWILGRVRDALRPLAAAELAGISDLAVGGLKVSGNAQQRKARYLLHHGSLLYAFEVQAVGRYLRAPEREPAYRAGREHTTFVTNLAADGEMLRRLVAGAFGAEPGAVTEPILARVPGLVAERYGRAEWVRRR